MLSYCTGGGGGGLKGQGWTRRCRSSRACLTAFIANSVPFRVRVFDTSPHCAALTSVTRAEGGMGGGGDWECAERGWATCGAEKIRHHCTAAQCGTVPGGGGGTAMPIDRKRRWGFPTGLWSAAAILSQPLEGRLDECSDFLEAVGHRGDVRADGADNGTRGNGLGPSNTVASFGTLLLGPRLARPNAARS